MRDDLVRLEGDETIVITRVFNAPPQVVFDAMTQPQHVRIWYGRSRSTQVTICEIDLRVGGHWRFVIQTQSGDEVDFWRMPDHRPPRHLVFTEIFAPFPETVSTIDTVYHDLSGRTRLVATCCTVRPRRRGTALSPPAWKAACAKLTTSSTYW